MESVFRVVRLGLGAKDTWRAFPLRSYLRAELSRYCEKYNDKVVKM